MKDKDKSPVRLFTMTPVSAAIVALAALLSGCGSDESSSDKRVNIPFEIIACPAIAYQSSITEASVARIQESHLFVERYLASDLNSQEQEPVIDFEKKSVIAIHMGQQASSGYQVLVTEINDNGAQIVVNYKVTAPGSGCNVNTVITYPYCFVSIDRAEKTIVYKESKVSAC